MSSVLSNLRQRHTLIALLVAAAFFMENLDGTIIATALPQMAQTFAATPEGMAIGMTAYLLTLAVFIPASGWVADRFGARSVFATAIVLFTLASVACGFSGSVVTFTVARVAQGAAGALMVPVGRLVVLRGTDRRDLLRAMATLTWPALVAPILGPPVGGFITHAYSWRWIFFINVPFGLIEVVAAWLLLRDQQPEGRRPFDSVGFLLNGVSLACLLYALDRFGQVGSDWGASAVVLGLSLALGLGAVLHAKRHAHPLVSLEAFGNRTFAISMTAGTISRITISTMPFLMPLLFQVGLGLDPFRSGLLVLWYGAANLGIKPFTSSILRRLGFRRVLVVNTVINASAIAACALITVGTPIVVTALLLMIAGSARSMQFTALNTLTFAELPASSTGPANTLFNMAFQLAIGMGIAFGAILLRVLGTVLPHGAAPVMPFHVAFVLIGLTALAGLVDFLRLDRDAGASVSGQTSRAAA